MCVKILWDCPEVRHTSYEMMIGLAFSVSHIIQAWIAQLVAYGLGTREVWGSNPGKVDNFSM